jgi:hypothetical protein
MIRAKSNVVIIIIRVQRLNRPPDPFMFQQVSCISYLSVAVATLQVINGADIFRMK